MTYTPINILVTGGCGFIGSNFICEFLDKYQDIFIVNIDCLNYCSNIKNITKDYKNYKFIKGDINSFDLVLHILKEYSIDTVIHFAAQSHVDNSFNNSLQFTRDNILGTHTLIEAVHQYGKVNKFIHMSTDEVYGEINDNNKRTEKSLLLPTNPYAATKAGAEHIIMSYNISFKLPIIIIRCNNVYGIKQYPEKVIPKFITHLLSNKKCPLHGTGKTLRSFIHTNDVSNAIDIIIKNGKIGEIYNISSKDEYTVFEIAKILVRKIKNEPIDKWIEYTEDRKFNDKRYYIDSTKLISLGWKQTVHFENEIDNIIDYYIKYNILYNI